MNAVKFPKFTDVINLLSNPAPQKLIEELHAAHRFAQEVHGHQRRLSGELFVEHDLAVAHTIGEIKIDTKSLLAGLMHDTLTVCHTDHEKCERQMRQQFGTEVSGIVKGLQALTPYTSLSGTEDANNIERLRRAILNIDDLRVLLIRLADHLQDLRMASVMPQEHALVIAREASEIYAPIANRLGIWSLKWQLEDLSFRYLYPCQHEHIVQHISKNQAERKTEIEKLVRQIQRKLETARIRASVTGRPKHIVSIHRKMKRKNVPIQEIYDLRAVRVVVDEGDIGKCYQVLGIIHNMWLPIPEEFDDYIANPKPNGYKSLHTAVYDHTGQVLEVQIRTRTMHEEAERGIAAHWVYKEGASKMSREFAQRVEWMRHLLIDLRDESREDVPLTERMINIDDLNKRIYVFTPQGELKELPDGATPIDFAYQIHTEVGHRCRGAIVNSRMVSLNHQLEQGDAVQILTSKRGGPNRDWMNESLGYTKSGRTRNRIRQWFRIHDRTTHILQGREILERELKHLRLQKSLTIEEIAQSFNESEPDFLAKVGFGDIQFSQVTGAIGLIKERQRRERREQEEALDEPVIVPAHPNGRQKGLTIQGLTGLHHNFANCCKPIPPEPVKGYVTRGRGVTIHHRDCEQFKSHAKKEPGRVLEVSWGIEDETAQYEIPLMVSAFRLPELAENIATVVSGRQINLVRTKSVTDKRGLTTVYLVVSVHNMADLNWLKNKLENMSHVIEVKRQI